MFSCLTLTLPCPPIIRYRDSREFRDSNISHSDKQHDPSRPETVLIEDLLCHPGRLKRPRHILVILRGLPGSGKTFVAKLIKVSFNVFQSIF